MGFRDVLIGKGKWDDAQISGVLGWVSRTPSMVSDEMYSTKPTNRTALIARV